MAKKEISWQFIWETRSQKYFLIEKTKGEYIIFRTPTSAKEGSKNYFTLEQWSGETLPWGGVPAKVRNWLLRQGLKPNPEKQDTLTSQT